MNIAEINKSFKDLFTKSKLGVLKNTYNQGHNLRRQWFLAYKTLNFGAIFKIFCMFV